MGVSGGSRPMGERFGILCSVITYSAELHSHLGSLVQKISHSFFNKNNSIFSCYVDGAELKVRHI
jgi:hypothetical protein